MKTYHLLAATFLILCNFSLNYGYNILALFPHPGISHFYFFQPLLKELARKGHNLTVVSNFPEKNPIKNYIDITLSDNVMKEDIELGIFELIGKPPPIATFFKINSWGLEACEIAVKSNAVQKILNPESKYDLVLIEQFNNDCMLGIAYLKNAPVIGLSSSSILPWHYRRMGSPFITSYMPDVLLGISENMSFVNRLTNWFCYHLSNLMYRYLTQPATNKILRKYLNESLPDVQDLSEKIKLMLVNQHYSFSGAKPWSPSVIEVSGLQIQDPKPLDEKFKKILDSSKNGVIYISWGSLIRSDSLPIPKREAILRALSKLQYTVLWKWENGTIPNCPKNVHIFKWMPQRDILSHPNVKVFMNHGGLLGTTESIYNGVPMVTTPILGDQFLNAAAVENRKIGVILPFTEITEENVIKALEVALSSEYQTNAKSVSLVYKSRPDTPLNTAVWWVEHVAHMKGYILTESKATELPWYIYYSCDIYLAVFIIILLIYYLIKLFIKLIRLIRNFRREKQKKN
ncbi:UDP-glycosyltransferase UGT5-like [Condylostylus longicornis]|uniref:UDP-glycosyltransferase UGT5-like n=1 Tax=Condylostylus longicornis TaxID=2530218 RepID=UPI00244DD5C9|nr:UDP-glycosyltransferase UGT5-like [Condylostylus longicornis]XP_055385992.1 UDP-glycosyltransferase UGT5-like [Condylostylus longicornis]